MRVDVPGTTRTLESLEGGAVETFEIPLAGKVRSIAVSFLGPRTQRRIEIPLPEERVRIAPPGIRIERSRFVVTIDKLYQMKKGGGDNTAPLFL